MEKIAVVTGGTRGIGLAITKMLSDEGYRVLACGRKEAPEALLKIERCTFVQCDIANADDREALAGQVEQLGRLDILVNNAGVAPKERMDILQTTQESFDRVVGTNLKGTFFMCQRFANVMLECLQHGLSDYHPRIVNISSCSSYTASVNRGEYCISKAGISMVTKLFAAHLAPMGILVFEVRPGIIQTDMTKTVQAAYEERIQNGLTPIKRMGRPEDVANCVKALCSGLMDFAPGQAIEADGGFHIRRL